MKRLFLGVCLLSIAACSSTLPTKDCASLNWRERGGADVAQGAPVTQFYKYQEICSKVGVVPNEAEYVEGYVKGQKEFCSFDNGFKEGKQGKALGDVCPNDSDFVKGFVEGRQAYAEEREKRQAENLTRGGTSMPSAPGGGPP